MQLAVIIFALGLIASFGGLAAYFYDKVQDDAVAISQFEETQSILVASNKQLNEKLKRQQELDRRESKLRSDNEKRINESKKNGCAELDDLIPACIGRLRHEAYSDYLRVREELLSASPAPAE